MSQAEIFEQLRAYGAHLITKDDTIDVSEPSFDLSFEDYMEIMNTVAGSKDEYLRVGFAAIVTKQVSSIFRKLVVSERTLLRDAFLGYATSITDERELPAVLETISGLWLKFSGDWPDLVDFILDGSEERNILVKANIITTCPFMKDESFLKIHSAKLVPVLLKLLTGYPELDVPRITIVMLLATCQPKLSLEIMDNVWNVILGIDTERERNNTAIPAIFSFFSIPGYASIQPTPVKAIADVFADSNSDLDARLAAITPLIPFFAFLDSATFHTILPAMVEALAINFYDARILIDMLSEADLDTLNETTVNEIFRYLSEMRTPELKDAALALLGPFVEMVVRENPETLEPISQEILLRLREGGFKTVVGCITLRYLASVLEKENKELFHELLQWVVADDENVMIEAYKTMKKLLATQMYSTDENEKDLLSLYPSFAPSEFMRFIRLVEVLLENAEDPGIAFAEPIYEFAFPLISSERVMRDNAVGLALCRQLLLLSSEYVEDNVVDLINVAANILNSNESEFFPPAIEILGDIVDTFKQDRDMVESVLSLLPRMQEIMRREIPIENKQFSQAANGIAHIVSICDLRDIAPDICQMGLDFIRSADETEEVYSLQILGSSLLNTLANTLIPHTAKDLFKELAQFVVTATDPDVVSNILQALTSIVKKYGTKIDFADANELADKLMNGKTASIKKVMSMDEESDSGVFDYMKQFVKKFKQNTIGHVHSLMSVFPSVSTFIIPSVAIPISKALKIRILSPDSVGEFFVTLEKMMDENEDDLEVLAEIFSLVLDIKRNYLEVIACDIPTLIKRLEQIFDVYGDAEDEPELSQLMSLLLLELYSASKDGENVTQDILIGIVNCLPFPAESCDLQFMLEAVTELTKLDWAQKMEIIQAIAKMLARVLLMKKAEIDEYQVEAYTLTRAKNCLKILCKANKDVENCVRLNVCNSKAKQSVFNAILK